MDWLNYHHLRYFWMVAKEGGLRRAAAKLGVSQPSISAQVAELETAFGAALFRRQGRTRVLTEAGQVVFRFADEIFALGGELTHALRHRSKSPSTRLYVGLADSFPKLLTCEILRPVFEMPEAARIVCREGKLEDLLGQLAAHRLDIVLADEPAPSGTPVRTFNHPLGESAIAFCAAGSSAAAWKRGFPRSLHEAPAFLPSENTPLRREVEAWFRSLEIRPRVVAEFDDLALMKVMAADGRGFVVLPEVVVSEAVSRYGFRVLGTTRDYVLQFRAITAERRMVHPAVVRITDHARRKLTEIGARDPARSTGAGRVSEPGSRRL
ncbi:MAG: LysR family transcriptional regulator [Verrucomicrobiales bacterium]|nr:LysR family transcriptional regulator [Verrucomicrobiales bacterium]